MNYEEALAFVGRHNPHRSRTDLENSDVTLKSLLTILEEVGCLDEDDGSDAPTTEERAADWERRFHSVQQDCDRLRELANERAAWKAQCACLEKKVAELENTVRAQEQSYAGALEEVAQAKRAAQAVREEAATDHVKLDAIRDLLCRANLVDPDPIV